MKLDARFRGHDNLIYALLSNAFRIASVIAVGEGGIAKGPVDLSPARTPQQRAYERDARQSLRYFDLSKAFKIASVIAVVPTLFMPGCMMSPVRKPSASTLSTAFSNRAASSFRAKE